MNPHFNKDFMGFCLGFQTPEVTLFSGIIVKCVKWLIWYWLILRRSV